MSWLGYKLRFGVGNYVRSYFLYIPDNNVQQISALQMCSPIILPISTDKRTQYTVTLHTQRIFLSTLRQERKKGTEPPTELAGTD